MVDEKCAFCEIVDGHDETTQIVKSWPDAIAFSPLHPATDGHLLVIPKQHYKDILELPMENSAELWSHVTETSRAVNDSLKPDGLNIITSAGHAATQSVFHLHIHVVPRYFNDRIVDFWPVTGVPADMTRRALPLIRAQLNPTDGR